MTEMNNDENVDMDEMAKIEDTDIDSETEKEPESTLGEDNTIDEEAEDATDSAVDDCL